MPAPDFRGSAWPFTLPDPATEPATEAEVVAALLSFRRTQKRTLGKLKVRALIEAGRK